MRWIGSLARLCGSPISAAAGAARSAATEVSARRSRATASESPGHCWWRFRRPSRRRRSRPSRSRTPTCSAAAVKPSLCKECAAATNLMRPPPSSLYEGLMFNFNFNEVTAAARGEAIRKAKRPDRKRNYLQLAVSAQSGRGAWASALLARDLTSSCGMPRKGRRHRCAGTAARTGLRC